MLFGDVVFVNVLIVFEVMIVMGSVLGLNFDLCCNLIGVDFYFVDF